MIPNTLSIAGIDPSGGAGILADVKTMSALGAFACAVVAALTAQNTQTVSEIFAVAPHFVGQQIDTLFADVRIDAVKIGMLGQAAVITTVAEKLLHWQPKYIVLDPVMVAKSGALLLEKKAIHVLRVELLPQVTVLMPNLPEASALLDQTSIESLKEMRRAAENLRNKMTISTNGWVWLKGGHLPGNHLIDLLHDGDRMIELPTTRIDTRNVHGTGCTLSAALTALLPRHQDIVQAAQQAKAYLTTAIEQAERLSVGRGHGPVHHFHKWW